MASQLDAPSEVAEIETYSEGGPHVALLVDEPLENRLPQSNGHADLLTTDDPWANGWDWPIVSWIVLAHVGGLAAPFFFTWKALGVCCVLAWLTGSIGVCMGYHRQLTHGS